MKLSDAMEKIPIDTTGDRSWDLSKIVQLRTLNNRVMISEVLKLVHVETEILKLNIFYDKKCT
jgi:hypothetical protein